MVASSAPSESNLLKPENNVLERCVCTAETKKHRHGSRDSPMLQAAMTGGRDVTKPRPLPFQMYALWCVDACWTETEPHSDGTDEASPSSEP